MPTVKVESRVYPVACQSAFCGRAECPERCPSLPELRRFLRWVDESGATVEDETWCPTVYTAATVDDGSGERRAPVALVAEMSRRGGGR